jgi:hypothetical protein
MRAGLAALTLTVLPAIALADDAGVPFGDTEVVVDRGHGVLRVARVGLADERIGRFGARQRSARERGAERARQALDAFVDDRAAGLALTPQVASALHVVVRDSSRVVAIRALVDASAVVVVEVPIAALAAAGAPEGFP